MPYAHIQELVWYDNEHTAPIRFGEMNLIDARHAKAVLDMAANKTDANDAMLKSGQAFERAAAV